MLQPRLLPLLLLSPFLASASPQNPWPAGINPSEKYWPAGQGPPSKRSLEYLVSLANSSLLDSHPKMPFSPAEKFLDAFWLSPYSPPARLHYSAGSLFKRADWKCTSGRHVCSDINRPQQCCANSETCVIIDNIGYGDVGCCAEGQKCSGNLSGCGKGKIACDRKIGGGCCTEGTTCSPNGCVTEDKEDKPASASASASPTTTCANGYYACPTNRAGGCCPSGRLCGVTDCPTMTASPEGCPVGYFTCAAEFSGGCCRNGRRCDVKACPAATGGDVGAGGVVAAATGSVSSITKPPEATATALCADGWKACAANAGGGCCPEGYDCAVGSCPAKTVAVKTTGGATATVTLPPTAKKEQSNFFIHSGAGKRESTVVLASLVAGVVAAMLR